MFKSSSGTAEVVQLVKCLTYKLEDLSSYPQSLHFYVVLARLQAYNPCAGEVETGESLGLASQCV